jgi:2-amino-4-hydroxy-6-hydroxymethyldihydropteridine diphosphokinase
MARVFISVGSNIDPYTNVRRALHLLRQHMSFEGISTVYLTPPEDRPEQSRYYNCVVVGETRVPPLQFSASILKPIEAALGRVRTEDKYAARQIDLDLILYNDAVLKTGDIELPSPEIRTRPYVAIPLGELSPDLVIPGSRDVVAAIAAAMPKGKMEPLEQYTRMLRKELLKYEHHKS